MVRYSGPQCTYDSDRATKQKGPDRGKRCRAQGNTKIKHRSGSIAASTVSACVHHCFLVATKGEPAASDYGSICRGELIAARLQPCITATTAVQKCSPHRVNYWPGDCFITFNVVAFVRLVLHLLLFAAALFAFCKILSLQAR